MRMITLKAASGAGLTAEVRIPVHGGEGVNLKAIGWVLGLEPSTVRLNGHFLSRGPDFVSSLQWDSLLSFFASRGLPAGASLQDSIFVQGKPIDQAGSYSFPNAESLSHLGFKRKVPFNNESSCKKSRLFEGCSKKQNVETEQATEGFLSVKRYLKLSNDHPSKKGKIGECNSDWHSSSNMKNSVDLCFNRKDTREDEKIQRNNILLEYSTMEQNFFAEQDNNDDSFCMKRRLKLEDDHPFKRLKFDEHTSGLYNEASKLPMVFTKSG